MTDMLSRINDDLDYRSISQDVSEITIAKNSDVGDGRPVDLTRLQFSQYERNPIVRWNHGHTNEGLPIARTNKIYRRADGAIRAQFEFLPNDVFASRVKNAWDKGFIRAASITWTTPVNEAEAPQLREWSLVDIPADADAVRSLAKSTLQYVLDEPLNEQRSQQGEKKLDKSEIEALVSDMLKKALPDQKTETSQVVDVDGIRSAITASMTEAFEQREEATKKAAEETERATKLESEMREKANQRAAILAEAKSFLPADTDTNALSNRELMEKTLGDSVKIDSSRSDDYVQARFDAFVEQSKQQTNTQNPQQSSGLQTMNSPIPMTVNNQQRSAAHPLALSILDQIKLKNSAKGVS